MPTGDVDVYEFAAKKNDTIKICVSGTNQIGATNVEVGVIKPDSDWLGDNNFIWKEPCTDLFRVVEPGLYKILIRNWFPDAVDYRVDLLHWPGNEPPEANETSFLDPGIHYPAQSRQK